MNMNIKMNLRKQILLGYLVPLLMMAGVCASVVWNTQAQLQISKSVELAYAIVSNVKDLHLDTAEMQRSARGYILFKNETSRKTYNDADALYRDKLQALGKQIRDPKQLENLSHIAATSERLAEATAKEMQLVDAGQASEAVKLFSAGTGIELGGALEKLISEFEMRETEILAGRQLEESHAVESLVILVLVATGLAVVLALVLGWWIAARISQSIGEAIAGMSTSSIEIAASVNETTSTVEELGASSRQSATQAESMATGASQSLDATQEGIRLANQVAASMTDMKQKVGSVAEQILRLSEHAAQIGGIAKVVGELAGETNMLALNAAVEAARAGEHGKGFAVVAAEIRKLADQSKKSAERTDTLVSEIQKATNSAVMVTEEGSKTADEVAAIIDKTLAAFGSISTTVSSVSVGAQQVLLNSRQQAAALGQVTEAMKSLAAGTTQLKGVALDLTAMV